MRTRLTQRIPARLDLEVATHGHGWIQLAPHAWEAPRWSTAMDTPSGAADVSIWVSGPDSRTLVTRVTTRRPLSTDHRAAIRQQVRRCLRLDDDLEELWSLCDATGRKWVRRRGAGRILRSPTVFEDLVKLLFTTNCTWAATLAMSSALVEWKGRTTPSGAKTFPTAGDLDGVTEAELREHARVGYRAGSLQRLVEGFLDGTLRESWFDDPDLPTDTVRHRLLELPGFGPYAAGQALRLLGRYDDLALDSWCRARLAQQAGRRKPPSDRTVLRRYRPHGRWAGLMLWLDLTAEWFGEDPGSP